MSGHALRVTNGVLLTGYAIEVALDAVLIAQRYRAGQGLSSRAQDQLAAVLRDAMSPAGHGDSAEEAKGQAEVRGSWVAAAEAAELLGCSTRTVRRLARRLGGQVVGGRLLLDRQAVIEHIEGRDAS